MITFTIPGIPIPKARPRVMKGGWTYTPKRTKDMEEYIRIIAQKVLKRTKDSILGPNCTEKLFVSVVFYGARSNADLDNLFKTVTDACQGVLYKNDSQIDDAHIVREDANKGEEHTYVQIGRVIDRGRF